MDRPIFSQIKKIKDPLGFHKVKVYNGTDILKYILHNRIHAQSKKQDSLYLVSGLEGCQPKGNKVMMSTGKFKNVEDIRVGDCVLSPLEDGTYIYSNVIQLHQFYSQKNYTIKTLHRNQKELYSCSYNHIIPMNKVISHRIKGLRNKYNREWKIIEKTAEEWSKYTYEGLKNFTTPLASPIPNFSDNYECEIEPYTLGVFLGDGSLSRKGLNITSDDPIIIEYISQYYKCMSIGNKQKTTCKSYRYSTDSLLFKQLLSLGLIGTRSGNKFIPERAKYSSIDYRRKLLAGLIDTDGYYGGKRNQDVIGRGRGGGSYSITSKSKQLIEDIAFICGTLGYRHNIRTITKTIKSIDFMGVYYEISIYISADNPLPMLLERKKHTGSQFYLSSNRLSIKLEETSPNIVYGFTLDSPSGLYITNNFCVTHNSGKSNLTITAYDLYLQIKNEKGDIENITRNVDELMSRYAKLQRNNFITLDEAQELASDRWNEKKAKEIKEKFTVMRERAFISMICYPNPLKVSIYFREDRVRGVFFLKKAGEVYFYANSNENPHFTNILESWDKYNKTRSIKQITRYAPDFIMYYPEYVGELRELYDKRKDENISKVLGTNITIEVPENYISVKDSEKYLKRGRMFVVRLIEKQLLNVYYIGLDKYFTKEELDTYISNVQKKHLIQSKDATHQEG